MNYRETARGERAEKLFREGYNCTQAVVLAFSDILPYDEKLLVMTASGFGGGFGRLREVCGAASGITMVLGMLEGYSDPKSLSDKGEMYGKVQELLGKFRELNGSIVCREMLGLTGSQSPVPEARTAEYYKKRPCPEIIRIAANILQCYIEDKKGEKE